MPLALQPIPTERMDYAPDTGSKTGRRLMCDRFRVGNDSRRGRIKLERAES